MAKAFTQKLSPRSLLLVILLLAALLRLWKLDQVPINLFGDEVDVGYQAYSLLKTGRDYMGQFLPFYIHSLSEWRAPLFIYSTIPTVLVFGLNEWGVRLSSAVFGILGVYLIYLLGKRLYSERVGLIAALSLAILPWHIHYSRAAFEVTLLLVLLLSGTLLFWGAKTSARVITSAILFALTPYTYSTAVIFTPLYMLLLTFLSRKIIGRKELVSFFVAAVVVAVPFIQITIFGPAAGRFSLLSVFNNDRILDEINIERTETGLATERLFHNKLVGWGEIIASNYVRSFSPEFLFVHGDQNPRHSVPGVGVFYWGSLIFLLVGFYKLISDKNRAVLVGWLLLSPIPASLTVDGANHATRLFLMIPPLVLATAIGIDSLLLARGKLARVVFSTSLILTIGNLFFYQHRYFTHYNLQMWRYWHFGYKEVMQAVAHKQSSYKLVFLNNTYEPSLLHYLFWNKYDPAEFQRQFRGDIPKEGAYPNFDGFALTDKFYFGQANNLITFLQPGMLYLAAQGKEIPGDWDWEKSPPQGVKVLDLVRTPQGQPLFTLVARE